MNLVTFTPSYYPDPTKGKPLGGGFVYIGEPDTDPTVVGNQQTVSALQENGNLVAIAQPITLNAGGSPTYNGSVVSLFVTGDYSSTVQDSNAAQFSYTPRTTSQAATGTQFPVWDIGTTYAQNAYVTGSDDRLYYSIAGTNLGNDPTSTTGAWNEMAEIVDGVITADLVGNVTGDVTGNVEGDLTGNADSATKIGVLNMKVIEIGDWDMDATTNVNVPHGLSDQAKIRSVDVIIRDDIGTAVSKLTKGTTAPTDTTPQGTISGFNATNIPLIRLTGGSFDSVNFDSTSYNRGWVTIGYVD